MSRLVVISNRVALPKQTQTGGLASAMASFFFTMYIVLHLWTIPRQQTAPGRW